MTGMIVTIDGPAGSGKSTAARGLARRLGFDYIDTGAMYRAVAHSCLEAGIDTTDPVRVTDQAGRLQIHFDDQAVLVDGVDITVALRSPSISEAASRVAQHPGVRAEMVRQQQAMVGRRNLVTEGRDQGTARGGDVPLDDTLDQIRQRDDRDRTREVSPLRPADDALIIDSSQLTAEQVLDQLETRSRERLGDLTRSAGC